MDVLDTRDELICQEQDSLQRELPVAEVEQILQTGAEKVKDHGIVVTFGSEPTHEWNTDTAGQGLVDTSLIFELGVLGLYALELDGNLLARDDVGAKVDVTETTATDLTSNAVLITYSKILYAGKNVSNRTTRRGYNTCCLGVDEGTAGHSQGEARRKSSRRGCGPITLCATRARPYISGRRCPLEGEEREYKPVGWISTWKRVDSP